MGFYTESARQMINPMDVPRFLEESAITERKLFEGLIELDFAEVYCESGLAFLTEEEKAEAEETGNKAIGTAIKAVWDKFVEALKTAYDNIKEKLTDFFNKTASLVSSKLVQNPKAKDCTAQDIWFANYADELDKLVNISELNKILTKITNAEIGSDYESTTADFRRALDDAINKVPTNVPEYEGGKKSTSVKPVVLGKQDLAALQKALSVGGLGQDIHAIFKTLSTDDSMKFTVKETDSEGVKKGKMALASNVGKAKLAFFSAKIKIITNTSKIARRNYTTIASFVKGGEEAKNEAAGIYEAYSDMLCESVFGI